MYLLSKLSNNYLVIKSSLLLFSDRDELIKHTKEIHTGMYQIIRFYNPFKKIISPPLYWNSFEKTFTLAKNVSTVFYLDYF